MKKQTVSKAKGFQRGDLNPSRNPARRKQIREQMLGNVLSDKTKNKISKSMKEALKNPETKEKWVKAATGRKLSKETRDKISMAHSKRPKSVAGLKKKADNLFSRYIRTRDSWNSPNGRVGHCITCDKLTDAFNGMGGVHSNGQAGHFMSRRFNSTRYDERNVNLQCSKCNMWGAGEQYKYSIAVDKKFGKGTAAKLHEEAKKIKQWKVYELEDLIEEYKTKLKALDNDKP